MNTTQDTDKDICNHCSGTGDDPECLADACPSCQGVGSLVPLETILADGVANVRELLDDAIEGGGGDYEEVTYRNVAAWFGDLPKLPALLKALENCIQVMERLPNFHGSSRVTCLEQAKAALAQVGGGK